MGIVMHGPSAHDAPLQRWLTGNETLVCCSTRQGTWPWVLQAGWVLQATAAHVTLMLAKRVCAFAKGALLISDAPPQHQHTLNNLPHLIQ